MQPIVLTEKGVHVPLEDGTVVLEEHRHYQVRLPGVNRAWLGALELHPSPAGGFAVQVGGAVGHNTLHTRSELGEQSWPVRIHPREEKLSEALWLSMVSEIEAWLPGISVGVAGARHGAVDREGVSLPLLVEALAPLIPMLDSALRALLRRPRERQETFVEDVPLHATRRADREAMTWLGRHPDVAQWLQPWEASARTGPPPRLPQRLVRDTTDHPANRYTSWLVLRVVHVLREAAARLDVLGRGHDETARWCRARSIRVALGADRLHEIWRRSFLRRLPREPASEAALLVVLDDPVYAAVHRIGRRFLSPLFRLEASDAPGAAVVPSFTMYELWCLLAVGRQLEHVLVEGWTWTWTGMGALRHPTGDGTGACLTGVHEAGELVLEFNPVYLGQLDSRSSARRSLSTQRRPDLEASWRPRHGAGRWVCLDAKYRAGKSNLGQAFESVHIYRDALRFEGMGGSCRGACLLAPARTPEVARWFSRAFRDAHQAGIWELRPGVPTPPELARWIVATLGVPDSPRETP